MPPIEGFGVARDRGPALGRRRDRACAPSPSAPRRAARAVAGGGLLGLEAAYALHKLGLKTVVLERSDRLLRRQLDARAAEILRQLPRGPRARVRDGGEGRVGRRQRTPARRRTSARPQHRGAHPARRRRHPAERRARPRGAGSRIKRGVLVDERMRTDDPSVLAAGDVAEFDEPAARPVADRGRPGGGRGRHRRGRRQGLQGHRAGHDPQGRRDRADLDRPLRAHRAGRRGDRARGRRRHQVPQARHLGRADRRRDPARLRARGRRPSAPRSRKGVDVTPYLDALRGGNWDVLESLG